MDDNSLFDILGINAGQRKPSWVFRGGLFVINHVVASYKQTDIDGDDLLSAAERTQDTKIRVFVFDNRRFNQFVKTDGYDHWTDALKERYLLENAAIGLRRGNVFVIAGKYANDAADPQYLPQSARGVNRDAFKKFMSIG